jgi:hypothetical protein
MATLLYNGSAVIALAVAGIGSGLVSIFLWFALTEEQSYAVKFADPHEFVVLQNLGWDGSRQATVPAG